MLDDPSVRRHTLDVAEQHGFSFDAVQLPLEVRDAHYRSFAESISLEATRGQVTVEASDNVVVRGEIVELN